MDHTDFRTDHLLQSYIAGQYGTDAIPAVLKENGLQFVFGTAENDTDNLFNTANVMQLQNELLRICDRFRENGIAYVTYKGAVLANRLYTKAGTRCFTDIDIYVYPEHFEQALSLLCADGYTTETADASAESHHVPLTKRRIYVELHKHILNPITEIDESYLLTHTEPLCLSGHTVTVLSPTAALLQLLYHLYMHEYVPVHNLYAVFSRERVPRSECFLRCLYEIALFAERYADIIRWDEAAQDIARQPLHSVFRRLFTEILHIFPGILPERFTNAVAEMPVKADISDRFYTYALDRRDAKRTSDGDILGGFVESFRTRGKDEDIRLNPGSPFQTALPSEGGGTVPNCRTRIDVTDDGLLLRFTVACDTFHYSEPQNYDTLTSDGIHLLLCGTTPFSYNSIFLFPKESDNGIRIVPVDVRIGTKIERLPERLADARIKRKNGGYTLYCLLTARFLREKNLDHHLYLRFAAVFCDPVTGRRNRTLTFPTKTGEWFDPSDFAKILL